MKRGAIIVLMLLGFLLNAQDWVNIARRDTSSLERFDGENTKKKKIPQAFKSGEWLKFRVHYGFLNASYATLHLTTTEIGDVPVYHVVGRGKTTGFASIFFKVDDRYESYFDRRDGKPYRFIRKISEGGYTRDQEINFDHSKDLALFYDKKNNKKLNFTVQDSIQDLISAFYYLRNNFDAEDLVEGESIEYDGRNPQYVCPEGKWLSAICVLHISSQELFKEGLVNVKYQNFAIFDSFD